MVLREYDLVIGESFKQKDPDKSYTQVKFDFIPGSVDQSSQSDGRFSSKPGQASITLPGKEGQPGATFEGSQIPSKRCVLIIDPSKTPPTITLERVSQYYSVKQVRNKQHKKAALREGAITPVAGGMSKSKIKNLLKERRTDRGTPVNNVPAKKAKETHGKDLLEVVPQEPVPAPTVPAPIIQESTVPSIKIPKAALSIPPTATFEPAPVAAPPPIPVHQPIQPPIQQPIIHPKVSALKEESARPDSRTSNLSDSSDDESNSNSSSDSDSSSSSNGSSSSSNSSSTSSNTNTPNTPAMAQGAPVAPPVQTQSNLVAVNNQALDYLRVDQPDPVLRSQQSEIRRDLEMSSSESDDD